MRFVAGTHNDANGSCMQGQDAGKEYFGKQAESTRHTNRHAATKDMQPETFLVPLIARYHACRSQLEFK